MLEMGNSVFIFNPIIDSTPSSVIDPPNELVAAPTVRARAMKNVSSLPVTLFWMNIGRLRRVAPYPRSRTGIDKTILLWLHTFLTPPPSDVGTPNAVDTALAPAASLFRISMLGVP